jgi:hypothetical protein
VAGRRQGRFVLAGKPGRHKGAVEHHREQNEERLQHVSHGYSPDRDGVETRFR